MERPYIDPAIVDVGLLDLDLRALSAELTRRDLRLGELGLEAECRGLARTHGHRTLDDYYRDVLGVAPSNMAARVVLARRVGRLPRLKAAIEDGAIGFETATLLARVARTATEEAWLALANISTTKIFREHVNAAELHARAQGLALDSLAPPIHEQVDESGELERQVLSMVFARGSDNCTDSHGPEVAGAGAGPEAGPMSVWAFSEEAALGTVPLRLTLPDDLAVFWRDLEVLRIALVETHPM